MLACYTNTLSVRAGARFDLHASGEGKAILEIARVGAARHVVLRDELVLHEQAAPDRADMHGCNWPVTKTITTGSDWLSGYYDITLTGADGEISHHFICIRTNRARSKALLVLNTNTYHSYNYWGGANAYCDVTALMSGKAPLDVAMQGAIGVLSARRPFAQKLIAPPEDATRLVNPYKRAFEERPFAGDMAWIRRNRPSPYDGSAGFLHKWEHRFAAWAEREGLVLDYATDHDLEDRAALDGYACVILVGHSEYWSGPERDTLERFVDGGGRLAIFSGNTAFWRVRWEDDGARYICHKWNGFEAEPEAGANGTHLWSHPAFGRPEAAITGLSFLYGGYHRLGLCAARGQGGYTVYDDAHWALEGCDLYYGDVIGDGLPLIGYENDGCLIRFDERNLPAPVATLGVPEGLNIIAIAPVAFGEDARSPYHPIIPPEKLDVCAGIAYADASPAAQARQLRGHAVMASFTRGRGEVFNGGTTEWAHGLAADDPFITRITRNVLKRFGAMT